MRAVACRDARAIAAPDRRAILRVAMSPHEPYRRDDPRIGTIVAGNYRIARLLGRGGMARVYKAEDLTRGRIVAVKILHAELAADAVTLTRFQQEARTAAQIGHAHVVEVLAVGVEPGGAPFLVIEYVRGRSLAELLHAEGQLGVGRACRIACQVLEGLLAVHASGVVHRDLKPENVLLTTQDGVRDFVKLCDFGIATFAEAQQRSELTPTGRTMASPHYASPEQLAGARGRDARVDLYAVGVILFEMLAGEKPFDAPALTDLFTKILEEQQPPLRVFRRDVPDALERLVARALAKAPEQRHGSAAELLAALQPFAAPPDASHEATDTITADLRDLSLRPRSEACPAEDVGVGYQVAGVLVHSLMAFLRARLAADVMHAALAALTFDDRALVSEPIALDAWYPGRPFAELLDAAERLAGTSDRRLAAEAGRDIARRMLGERLARAAGEGLTPEQFFSQLSLVWRSAHASGEARVARITRGHGLVEIVGQAQPRVARTVAAASFLEEALRLVGAKSVDVRLSRAEALGDDRDVFEATWS